VPAAAGPKERQGAEQLGRSLKALLAFDLRLSCCAVISGHVFHGFYGSCFVILSKYINLLLAFDTEPRTRESLIC
jgi:hypothetical protein